MFLGFTFGVDSISKEVVGFYPLWFPQGKYLCFLSLVIIVVHVVISDKVLQEHVFELFME